jgi:hypothetical protein
MVDTELSELQVIEKTLPIDLPMSALSFDSDERAHKALNRVHQCLSELSCYIDLTNLDGVTVSFSYQESLRLLDRGYKTNHVLTPTSDVAIGVAMSPGVLRDGKLKTHIVLNANYCSGLIDAEFESPEFQHSVHLLSHECAHVEVTSAFEKAFPGYLLRHKHESLLDRLKWQIILACWDEYAVCRIASTIGYDPTNDYLEIFLPYFLEAEGKIRSAIKSYRKHGNVQEVICRIYELVGNTMKYSSYYSGVLHGKSLNVCEVEEVKAKIMPTWFGEYFDQLVQAQERLFADFGKWESFENFEVIGEIADKIVTQFGISAQPLPNGDMYFAIP